MNPRVGIDTIATLCGAAALKAILFILCRWHGTVSANLLAQDQGNDVFSNITALACAYIGHKFWIYADPIGAFLIWYV